MWRRLHLGHPDLPFQHPPKATPHHGRRQQPVRHSFPYYTNHQLPPRLRTLHAPNGHSIHRRKLRVHPNLERLGVLRWLRLPSPRSKARRRLLRHPQRRRRVLLCRSMPDRDVSSRIRVQRLRVRPLERPSHGELLGRARAGRKARGAEVIERYNSMDIFMQT